MRLGDARLMKNLIADFDQRQVIFVSDNAYARAR